LGEAATLSLAVCRCVVPISDSRGYAIISGRQAIEIRLMFPKLDQRGKPRLRIKGKEFQTRAISKLIGETEALKY